MQKGILAGLIVSGCILSVCYYLFKYIYEIRGVGGAILISSLPLLFGILISSFFLRDKSKVITCTAKTILTISVLSLLLGISFIFR